MLPWCLKKTTIRNFSGVLEYPTAADHLSLAFIENGEDSPNAKLLPYYTSIKEFYEDPNNNSQLAEIWDGGQNFLGIRNKQLNSSSQTIDTGETDSGYTLSGDASTKAVDNVFYSKGSGSLRVAIVSSTSTAMVEHTFSSITDVLYKRKYYFRLVYIPASITSFTLRFGVDSSNYLYSTVTTQFSGAPFKTGNWNLLAMDLNNPTGTTGTINSSSAFAYEALVLTGAASGDWYLDESSLEEWSLLDYWYYSMYNIKTLGNTTANQKFFMDSSGVYSTDSEIICQDEFADVVMYDALISTIADVENSKLYPFFQSKRDDAWDKLLESFPSLEPAITTYGWNFASQNGNLVKPYEGERY
jgi:hypothetical protein